jgi:hypothetical protein
MTEVATWAIPKNLLDRLLTMNTGVFSPAINIVTDETYAPAEGETYIIAIYLPNETLTRYTGDDRGFHEGFLQVTVVSPIDGGTIPPRRIASDVIEYFKKGTIIDGNGVRVKINRQPWAAQTFKEQNRSPWFRTAVSIPYQCAP